MGNVRYGLTNARWWEPPLPQEVPPGTDGRLVRRAADALSERFLGGVVAIERRGGWLRVRSSLRLGEDGRLPDAAAWLARRVRVGSMEPLGAPRSVRVVWDVSGSAVELAYASPPAPGALVWAEVPRAAPEVWVWRRVQG